MIDGLHNDRWALLTKYHHATIDGASGQLMLKMVTDTEPDVPPPGSAHVGDRIAAGRRRAIARRRSNWLQILSQPCGFTRLVSKSPTRRASRRQQRGRPGRGRHQGRRPTGHRRPRLALPTTAAPPTPWNKTITAHRRFAMRTTSLNNVKRLKESTGATVNDIVMAIAPAGCVNTCWLTMRCPTGHCGRWCRCRFAPARKKTHGPTGYRPSSPTCRPTAPTHLNASPAAGRPC